MVLMCSTRTPEDLPDMVSQRCSLVFMKSLLQHRGMNSRALELAVKEKHRKIPKSQNPKIPHHQLT